mmetsp:Transcript_2009/g.4637  ORF Transcript_2009/g.4637 Transcript_2009/m.4637 type:complete len:204 (-) Transcript_2009:370-981(-)
MQPHCHHLRRATASFINQGAQTILEVRRELPAMGESIYGESHVVLTQRVRNNQMWAIAMLCRPVGQVIIVGIAIVEKTALFDDKSAGIDIGLALIHPNWSATNQVLVNLNGTVNMLSLNISRYVLIIPPTVPVAGNLPASLHHGPTCRRVALQRHTDRVYSAGDLLAREQIMKTPKPRPRAVVIQRLHVRVALIGIGVRTRNL